MTPLTYNTPSKVQDFDHAVDALSQELKAAGVHSTQVNPLPIRPQSLDYPIWCVTRRNLEPELPKDPQGGPIAGLKATTAVAGTYQHTPMPPDRSGHILFTVLDKSSSGRVGRDNGAQKNDSGTMKRVERVLDLLRRGRF